MPPSPKEARCYTPCYFQIPVIGREKSFYSVWPLFSQRLLTIHRGRIQKGAAPKVRQVFEDVVKLNLEGLISFEH